MKCVMIVDQNLPQGIIANTTAALGISLASLQEGLTGKKLKDGNDRTHEGLTNVPIPILALDADDLKTLYDNLLDHHAPDLRVIGFSDVAQKSHHYEDYEEKLLKTDKDAIHYLGVCLYGPKKKVNKLTGNIKILR